MENLLRIHHVAAHLCQLSVSTCIGETKERLTAALTQTAAPLHHVEAMAV